MQTSWVDSSVLQEWQPALNVAEFRSNERIQGLVAEIESQLQRNPERIPLSYFVDLLERIAAATPTTSLAWKTGQCAASFFGGDFGQAILGCKTLGAAFYWLCHFSPLRQDTTCVRLDVDDEWATISYKILDPGIWPRHEDALYSLGIFARLLKAAAPEAWSQVQLSLEIENDQLRPDLGSFVQAEIICGQTFNALRFPTSALDRPLRLVRSPDASLIKRLSRELTTKHRSTPISERTRVLIFTEMNDGCVSQDHIARELGLSSRTLRRRLSQEDVSFQSLLDGCRMQFAAHEFRTRKTLSLSDMALKLGYSEHSTFSRAFSRWAGMAPQEYRRNVAAF